MGPDEVRQRLRARLSRGEVGGLGIALALQIGFIVLYQGGLALAFDYGTFTDTALGDFGGFFYAHWSLPVFALLDSMPFTVGYGLWGLVNIVAMAFALRVFGGNPLIALAGFQMIYCIYYGQIVGVILGGLALMWWGMGVGRWWVAGLGLAVAVTKFQLGVPLGFALWLLADIRWVDRWKVALVPLLVMLVSLLVYPLWPVQLLADFAAEAPNDLGSVSLWRYVGPGVLVLWGLPFMPRLPLHRRLQAVVACMALALPYYQQTDLLALYMLSVGWLGLLGNLGYAMAFFGWQALSWLVVVPLIAYGGAIVGYARAWHLPRPMPDSAVP